MGTDTRPLNEANSSEGRPYRSHVHPACLLCKKRKSRCRTTDLSGSCTMCQTHGTECVFPHIDCRLPPGSSSSPRNQSAVGRRAKLARPNLMSPAAHGASRGIPRPLDAVGGVRSQLHPCVARSQGDPRPVTSNIRHNETMSTITGIVTDTGDSSSHVVSPAVVDDNNVLESYLSAMPEARSGCPIRTKSNTNRLARRVLFNSVPRRPLGVTVNQSLAATKCEVIEKYIEPMVRDLLDA